MQFYPEKCNSMSVTRSKKPYNPKRPYSRICRPGQIPYSGATYIRWGRSDCSHNNTRLVYSGYAGGSKYDASGGAVDNLCMPPDPDYEKTQGIDYGRLYGAEYNSNFFASNADFQDVPCAVCEAIDSVSIIMIPGKMNCYDEWKMEYNGYLAAHSYANPAATSYACIDKNPQFLPGGHVQYNEKVFGEVLTKCGSLPCPPYIEGYPVTCVVCSK